MGAYYKEYSEFLAEYFPGLKVQKISIDAGHSCPNRDGTLGRGGCIYCNNDAFSPPYCHRAGSVSSQIEAGIRFFSGKYPDMKYLAYFQAYTSTHAPLSDLIAAYEEAISTPGVVGLVVGTRPDCMSAELLSYLADIHATRMPVIVEYGVESLHEATLRLINRHHTSECAIDAIRRTSGVGIPVGVHLIMGLPAETDDMMMQSVRGVCEAGAKVLKLHQLQVITGTMLHRIWQAQRQEAAMPVGYESFPDVKTYTVDEYIELCRRVIEVTPPDVAIERFTASAPSRLLAAPRWGLKNYQFTHRLLAALR